jgi:hypothetical protein
MLSDKYSFTVFTTLWRVPVVNIFFYCLSNCHDFVTVIPFSPSINECRTHRVANFGVQQQTCGVNGFQPLQVGVHGMVARNFNVIVKSLVD